jgi:hypothetical protein
LPFATPIDVADDVAVAVVASKRGIASDSSHSTFGCCATRLRRRLSRTTSGAAFGSRSAMRSEMSGSRCDELTVSVATSPTIRVIAMFRFPFK